MVGNYRPDIVVTSDAFVREPVDDVCKKIEDSSSKKIILTGGRSSGKSIILKEAKRRGLVSNNKHIDVRFDSIGMSLGIKLNNEKFLTHYYEVVFALDLLSYIKTYYGIIYHNNSFYTSMSQIVNKLAIDTDKMIRDHFYIDSKLGKILTFGEITHPILRQFRKDVNLDSLTISMDRFDWTNGGKAIVQEILSGYFDLFDKAVITVDDETIDENKLKKKEFEIIKPTFNKDEKVIKEIIRRRITSDKNEQEIFDKCPDEMYKLIINNTSGNIDNMILTFYELVSLMKWRDHDDIMDIANYVSEDYNRQTEEMKKMSPPRIFYL